MGRTGKTQMLIPEHPGEGTEVMPRELVITQRIDGLYTVKEVAKLMATDTGRIYELHKRGLLRGMKLGSLKFRREEIQEFLLWAQGKDFSDLDHIRMLDTGEEAPSRWEAEPLCYSGNSKV